MRKIYTIIKKEILKILIHNFNFYYERKLKTVSISYFTINKGKKKSLIIQGKVCNRIANINNVELFYKNTQLSTYNLGLKSNFIFKINNIPYNKSIDFIVKYNHIPIKSYNTTGINFLSKSHSTDILNIEELINKGYYLTKKGDFLPKNVDLEKKIRYIDFFQKLSKIFKTEFNYNLTPSHGTLLGIIREKDFIEKDDDFDLMYISKYKDSRDVAKERTKILLKLRQKNIKSFISTTGHIQVLEDDLIIDLMPSWIDALDYLNISSYTSLKNTNNLFQEFQDVFFIDREIKITINPEVFLAYQYGENWIIPDSGYRSIIGEKEIFNRLVLSPKWHEFLRFSRYEKIYILKNILK